MASKREEEKKAKREIRAVNARDRADKADQGFGPSALKIPKEFSLFRFTHAGKYRLRILPWVISERKIDHRFGDPGFMTYEYTYFNHQRVGSEEKSYVCLRETFKKPCPICEFITKLDRWGDDKETYNALRAKQRQIFALYDLSDLDKGIQIFETSFFSGPGSFSLGQCIDNKVRASEEKYGTFFHPTDGKYLELSVKQGAFRGNAIYSITNIEMVEGKDLPEDILDEVPALDEFPIETPYKELKRIFNEKSSTDEDDEEADDAEEVSVPIFNKRKESSKKKVDEDEEMESLPSAPSKKKLVTKVVEDEEPFLTAQDLGISVGDTVEHDELGKCKVEKVTNGGLLLNLKDEKGKVTVGIPCDKVKLVETEEEEVVEKKPVEKASPKKKVVAVDEDEDDEDEDIEDDDWDDEEEEEEDEEDEEEPSAKSPKK